MVRTLTLVLAGALAIAACSAEPLARNWGPLAVVRSPGNGDMARIEGTLEITPTCVFLVSNGARVLLAWPDARTFWVPAAGPIEFTLASGQTFALFNGDRLALGGSGDDFAQFAARVEWVAPPGPECAVAEIWALGDVASL